jgi:hypothetical protein
MFWLRFVFHELGAVAQAAALTFSSLVNFSQLQSLLNQGQSALETLFPCTLSVNGAPGITAATSGLKREPRLSEDGGVIYIDAIAFRVRKSLLAAAPPSGTPVRWNEREMIFRVTSFSDRNDADQSWTIFAEGLTS